MLVRQSSGSGIQSTGTRPSSHYSISPKADCALVTAKVSATVALLFLGVGAVNALAGDSSVNEVIFVLGALSTAAAAISGTSYVYLGLSKMQ
jgi:hypothetical protein